MGSLSIKDSIAYDRIMDRQSQQQPRKARIFDILIRPSDFENSPGQIYAGI